jgi:hypothetical protein
MASQFCRFSQKEFEDFLGVRPDGKPHVKGGWHRLSLPGVYEVVYGKLVSSVLTLRIYSTLEGGFAREIGSDAIRVCVAWRPSEVDQKRFAFLATQRQQSHYPVWPMLVGHEFKVLRVQNWRDNLQKRLIAYQEILPESCVCGCPKVYRVPRRGSNWSPFWGCVWGRNCPGNRGLSARS